MLFTPDAVGIKVSPGHRYGTLSQFEQTLEVSTKPKTFIPPLDGPVVASRRKEGSWSRSPLVKAGPAAWPLAGVNSSRANGKKLRRKGVKMPVWQFLTPGVRFPEWEGWLLQNIDLQSYCFFPPTPFHPWRDPPALTSKVSLFIKIGVYCTLWSCVREGTPQVLNMLKKFPLQPYSWYSKDRMPL